MAWRQWSDRGIFLSSILLSRLINRGKDPKTLSFKRIIIFKEDEIGDLMNATPAFAMIRKQFPKAEITVVCHGFGVHMLQYCPDIDHVTDDYLTLAGKFDLIIDLRGSASSTLFALKNRPLYRLDRGSVRSKNRKLPRHPREIETNWQVIEPVMDSQNKLNDPRLHLSEKERKQAVDFLEQRNIKKFALFHTGARRILKKWPLERVAEVMSWLHTTYQTEIIVVGDKHDADDLSVLQPLLPFPIHQAAGEVGLLTFAAMCEKASIFIGNDSGPFHIAAAMGTPSLALFGPGDPVFYPHQPNAKFIHHVLECNPCDMVHCKYKENPCIQRITTDEVKEKLKEHLISLNYF